MIAQLPLSQPSVTALPSYAAEAQHRQLTQPNRPANQLMTRRRAVFAHLRGQWRRSGRERAGFLPRRAPLRAMCYRAVNCGLPVCGLTVPESCLRGASVLPERCQSSATVVPMWCLYGACMVPARPAVPAIRCFDAVGAIVVKCSTGRTTSQAGSVPSPLTLHTTLIVAPS